MSPNERAAYTATTASAGHTSADVHTRDANGNLLINGRRADGSEPAADSTAGTDIPPATTGEMIKIGDVELTAAEWAAAAAHKAEADLLATQIPARAEDYKLELPADLKLPDGVHIKIANRDDAIEGAAVVAATQFAEKHKLSQSAFSEMLGVYGAARANELAEFSRRQAAEFKSLGTAGPLRVDAVTRWMTANYGAAAKPMLSSMVTKAQVEILEDVISRLSSQGRSGGFRSTGRVEEQRGVSEEVYNSWSYGQKKEYAENAARSGGYRR